MLAEICIVKASWHTFSRYARAIRCNTIMNAATGDATHSSIAMLGKREGKLAVEERNILGFGYYEVVVPEGIRRPINARNYDISASNPHLEEAADLLEQTVESLLVLAAFETKIKRLGEEILRVSRRARVLEERMLPRPCRQD
jgi:V/A-type H+-transporting ATPase subunit D